jgi:DNA polymerase-3 subunit delta'
MSAVNQRLEISTIFPWQQAIWQHLTAYIEQQRIPQALLLVGASGLGKRHLAELYAGALLCQTPLATGVACGVCVACKLYHAQTHADYLVIEPDEAGKAIGIDKIRQLTVKLALKPQYDGFRLVIMQPADSLNTASANAFLKCLEEPTERTCFILITDQPAKLPATIRSRCQKISFVAADRQIARDWLAAQGVSEQCGQLLSLAQGAPLLAKVYADHGFIKHRQAYFQDWLDIAAGKNNLLLVAEKWQKQEIVALPILLTWLSSWIVDIVKLQCQNAALEINNPDFKKPLQAFAERLELTRLYHFYDKVLRSRSQLATQANKLLLLETLLIDWSHLNSN